MIFKFFYYVNCYAAKVAQCVDKTMLLHCFNGPMKFFKRREILQWPFQKKITKT